MSKKGNKAKTRVAAAIGVVALLCAVALIGYLVYCTMAEKTDPSPNLPEGAAVEDGDGFPEVDWDYWLSVNPDVIGWITIPGTDVNSPILQAHSDDPDHYLHYDVYGNYNPHGAIYLDAECEEYGLSSRNAVIMGHHFRNNPTSAPFGILADYKDYDFAAEHAEVLIQTPNTKMKYEVRFAQIVPGWEPVKRTSFESEQDYRQWYDESRNDAVMVLDGDTEPEQTISLVTCSYNFWVKNERTVVVTSIENSMQTAISISFNIEGGE